MMERIILTRKEFDELNLILSKTKLTTSEITLATEFIKNNVNPNFKVGCTRCKGLSKLKKTLKEGLDRVVILSDDDKICVTCNEVYKNSHYNSKYCDNCKK